MSGFQGQRGLFHLKLRGFPGHEREMHVLACAFTEDVFPWFSSHG